ncbi:MAG: mechanosensitive ion channel family protein [Paracoccaceae bacterium]|nr:mechanosensitive ion channel family protein [Paracoccaceae bacterium]
MRKAAQYLRLWLALLMLALAPVVTAGSALAQTQEQPAPPNYTAWEKTANRAEAIIADPQTTNAGLDALRKDMVDARSTFQAAQSANKTRIGTLQTQIAALGPVPADGATEAPEIAARRKTLNDQLAKLQAPGIAADEAYSRADAIIKEIDTLVRTRQADALMQLWPMPVDPGNWPAAVGSLTDIVSSLGGEVSDAWSIDNRRAELKNNLPVILAYLGIAVLLLARGRRWIDRLTERVLTPTKGRGWEILALIVSIGQIVLPFVGVLMLVLAVDLTGMVGMTGQKLLSVLPAMGLTVFAARWLGMQVFPRSDDRPVFRLAPERRAEGRIYFTALGVMVALEVLRRGLVGSGIAQNATNSVLSFPILAVAGLMLFRIARLLRKHIANDVEPEEATSYRDRLIGAMSTALTVISIGAPILGAIGYIAAATHIIYPTSLTLAFIALLIIAQRLVDDIYDWITGKNQSEDSALLPVLIGFTLTLLAMPIFALIWGARVSDLLELWTTVNAGFSIGSTRISPSNFITFLLLFAIGYGATRMVQGALKTSVLPKTRIDLGGQNAIVVGTGYLGLVLSALIAVTSAGIDLSSLAIVAGALSVGIGFGLQNIVSNFVSGIILLIERPVSEGDWIEVGGVQGTVRSISVRSTRIETFDRADVIVPNSNLITGTVTNMTKYSRVGRLIVKVGVAYGTDTRRVEKILREIAVAQPLVVLKPPPQVIFQGFGADSLDFDVRVILRDVNFVMDVRSELNHQIAERFAKEGIEIPFAQRDIWLRNPEVLRAAQAPVPVVTPEVELAPRAEPTSEPAPTAAKARSRSKPKETPQ